MSKYKFLSLEERIQIEVNLKLGKTHDQIADILDRSQSSITREINKSKEGKEEYLALRAHERSCKRVTIQRRKAPLKDYETWEYVIDRLKKLWSPEAIAGRMSKDIPSKSIHHETIYRYIYADASQHAELYQYLKFHRKKRIRKNGRKVRGTKIVNRVGINQRPTEVESRNVFGHCESDNMEGKKSDDQVISVTMERKSRFAFGDITDGKASSKADSINKRLNKIWAKTVTTDNGGENAYHQEWKVPVYFCQPYHSWEKGAVENVIGQLRKWIPKGESIQELTQSKLSWIIKQYNQTPKKCLDWRTPEEVFLEHTSNLLHATQLRI